MKPRVVLLLLTCAYLAGCTTLPHEAPGPDAKPLANQWPRPDSTMMLAYSEYWCARNAAERAVRRERLAPDSDRAELMLLEYCDLAHPDAPNPARDPARDPLARWKPEPRPEELVGYQQHWCARDAASRSKRRERLESPADDLELVLLDYCDNARRSPRAVAARLEAVAERGSWPPAYGPWFAWLQWHLHTFASVSTEAAAQQQHMQRTIDQLRAIERDMSDRDSSGTGSLK